MGEYASKYYSIGFCIDKLWVKAARDIIIARHGPNIAGLLEEHVCAALKDAWVSMW